MNTTIKLKYEPTLVVELSDGKQIIVAGVPRAALYTSVDIDQRFFVSATPEERDAVIYENVTRLVEELGNLVTRDPTSREQIVRFVSETVDTVVQRGLSRGP